MRHAGKPGEAAAAGKTKQKRFGLIVERMRGDDMRTACAHRFVRQ